MSGDLPDDPWRRGELGRHGDPVAVADPSEVATSEGLLSPYPQRLTSDEGLVVADGSTSEGASVVTDDLAAELAAHAPRRLWNKATVYLGAGALVVAGFLGGVQVQKNYGTAATTTTAPGAGRAGFAGNAAANGYFGGQAGTGTGAAGATGTAAAAATTGKVKLVDGTTVYVETSTGDVVTVKTGAQTQVKTSTTTTLKNLAAGDTVTIQGATGSDGTVTATTVTKDK